MLSSLYIILMSSYFLLPITALPKLSAVVPFTCDDRYDRPDKRIDPNDCYTIARNLKHRQWAKESATWGADQPGEFETPKRISHGTCQISITEKDEPSTPPVRDVFRLSDYVETMTMVIFTCFPSEAGETRGSFLVGPRKIFVVHIMPIQDDTDPVLALARGNETMYRSKD